MSNSNTTAKPPKKIGPIHLNKTNITRIFIVLVIIAIGVIIANNYISNQNKKFLENYSKAIIDIKQKNKARYKQDFKIFKQAVNSSNATSDDYYYLGYAYQYAIGTEKNYSNAYHNYKIAIASDNAKAYYQIGKLYEYGQGVNHNSKKALTYYDKSYQLGYKHAILAIKNLLKSDKKLFSQTDAKILYQIYLALNDNQIEENNPKEKYKFLSAASDKGYNPAMIANTKYLQKSKNDHKTLAKNNTSKITPQKPKRETTTKKKAKTKAKTENQNIKKLAIPKTQIKRLNTKGYEGLLYYFTNDKSPQISKIINITLKYNKVKPSSLNEPEKNKPENKKISHQQEIQKLLISAEKDNYISLYKLNQAVKNGDATAMYSLGEYYYKNKQYKTAVKYYNKAINKNYGPAYYKMAELYYNDNQDGLPYNKQKAIKYYQKAKDLGIKNANSILMLIM